MFLRLFSLLLPRHGGLQLPQLLVEAEVGGCEAVQPPPVGLVQLHHLAQLVLQLIHVFLLLAARLLRRNLGIKSSNYSMN